MSENRSHDDAAEIPDNFVKGVPERPGSNPTSESQAQANPSGKVGEGAGGEPSLEDQLQKLSDELNAARDQLLRSQADLENYRKRVQRERDEERRYAVLPLVRDLLPGLDNLQRALDAARHTDDLAAMIQGVEMIEAQFHEVFARHGTTPIPAIGEPFDPNLHEAIQQIPSADHPPMTVIDEVERGYILHDRVVRPSKVIVSAAPRGQSESDS